MTLDRDRSPPTVGIRYALRGVVAIPVPVSEELAPGTTLDWDFLEPRNLLVGSPEHVVERVQELKEVCGLEYLLIGHGHPGILQRLILRNLELFATKVMPAFKHSFGHRIPVA